MSSRPERVHTVDYHTGGEPFRIVEEPQPALLGEGLSVLDRREVALSLIHISEPTRPY